MFFPAFQINQGVLMVELNYTNTQDTFSENNFTITDWPTESLLLIFSNNHFSIKNIQLENLSNVSVLPGDAPPPSPH